MTITINELYSKIAQNIYDAIDDDWNVATLAFKHEEGSGEFEGVYKKDTESDVNHDFDVSYDTFNAFHKLHRITTEGQDLKWTKMIFTLYPTGEFEIDLEY